MRKNFFLIASLAVAVFATSCDNSNANSNEATANENNAPVAEASQPVIENPNVASEGGTTTPSENAPIMTFDETEYDFGTIKQGEVVEHTFTFTNTGKSPLVIESASATCGCTAPEPPKEPIAPGEKSSIKVKFNSAGKMGQQYPTVTVRANTEPNIVKISMKGTVESSNIPTAGAEGPVRRN